MRQSHSKIEYWYNETLKSDFFYPLYRGTEACRQIRSLWGSGGILHMRLVITRFYCIRLVSASLWKCSNPLLVVPKYNNRKWITACTPQNLRIMSLYRSIVPILAVFHVFIWSTNFYAWNTALIGWTMHSYVERISTKERKDGAYAM